MDKEKRSANDSEECHRSTSYRRKRKAEELKKQVAHLGSGLQRRIEQNERANEGKLCEVDADVSDPMILIDEVTVSSSMRKESAADIDQDVEMTEGHSHNQDQVVEMAHNQCDNMPSNYGVRIGCEAVPLVEEEVLSKGFKRSRSYSESQSSTSSAEIGCEAVPLVEGEVLSKGFKRSRSYSESQSSTSSSEMRDECGSVEAFFLEPEDRGGDNEYDDDWPVEGGESDGSLDEDEQIAEEELAQEGIGGVPAVDDGVSEEDVGVSEEEEDNPEVGRGDNGNERADDNDGDRADGDGGGGGDSDGSGAGGSDEDENDDNFNLLLPRLQTQLRVMRQITAREALALTLAVFVRYSLTYDCLTSFLTVMNVVLGMNYLPSSKKLLWRDLGRKDYGQKKYAYCKRCHRDLGLHRTLPNQVRCVCGLQLPKNRVCYFVILDLRRQLEKFLRSHGHLMYSKLQRRKRNLNGIEDIYDGQRFIHLQQGDNILSSPHNFSYTFNTDGFKFTKSSRLQAWPIYIRLNDLPVGLRQKYLFLASIWVGRGDADMNLFFKRFVTEANKLSNEGVLWTLNGEDVISKFVPTCCCVDSKARCIILNSAPPTGYFGCTFCTHPGVQANGVKFPNLPHPNVHQPAERRTDAQIRRDMVTARNQGAPHNGIQGLAAIMNMRFVDLGLNFSTDDLHPFFEGATAQHMSLLLDHADRDYYIGDPDTISLINRRLISIRHPKILSRYARGIDLRNKWRAHEWRNWILYYGVPCLKDILERRRMGRHLTLLSHLSRAIFLLTQQFILPNDLDEADQCIRNYVVGFEDLYGVQHMTFNIHILTHAVEVVRLWGPSWCHSTFPFESWNMRVRKNIKSPNQPINQIVTRHLIESFVARIPEDPDISERVKETITVILEGPERKRIERIGDVGLLDKGTWRRPTNQEQFCLAQRGIVCQHVTEYKRALYHRFEIRSINYTVPAKCDNTNIYTWDDMFCCVQSIIKVAHNGVVTPYLFVKVTNAADPLPVVSNIVQCAVNEGNDVFEMFTFSNVRAFAVNVVCDNVLYTVPIASTVEID